jgi:hypothetical protein
MIYEMSSNEFWSKFNLLSYYYYKTVKGHEYLGLNKLSGNSIFC